MQLKGRFGMRSPSGAPSEVRLARKVKTLEKLSVYG